LGSRNKSALTFTIGVLDHIEPVPAYENVIGEAPGNVDLLVLPYLGANPYFLAAADRRGYSHAERSPSRTLQAAVSGAMRRNVATVVSYYEAVGEGVFYATAAVIDRDGSIRGTYRQSHALNKPGWHEQLYFQPGTSGGFPVFEVGAAKIGLLLGSDLWVPEAARLLALSEADVIIAQVSLESADNDLANTLATARAIENGRAVLIANRAGESKAFDPFGSPVTFGPKPGGWSTVAIDIEEQRHRLLVHDPLRTRRPAIYGNLVRGGEGALP
jgi:N-carbamoylputrescine amidase